MTHDDALIPGQLRPLVEVAGWPAVCKLVEAYGGTRLYVPKSLGPDHELARLIGFDEALALAALLGGEPHFDIPRCAGLARAARDAGLRADRAAGMTFSQLARKYHMTERNVLNILGRERDERQGELFAVDV
ncbi:MAG: Mor transcription activator family protein [Methylotetracoccus sp.]